MSKSYGLPGLRVGWIACKDKEVISKMERLKHYLSICNSGPSERLTKIALNHQDKLFQRNCSIVDENLPKWDQFFSKYPDLFDWTRPDGACMGFPRYKGPEGVEQFCRSLVETSGVLLLPGTIYRSDLGPTPTDRFRLGFGRKGLDEGLGALVEHIEQHR